MGAIVEMEFMRKLKELAFPKMKYYVLGDFNITCNKLIYKQKFAPGEVMCPSSKDYMPLIEAMPKIKEFKQKKVLEKRKVSLYDVHIHDLNQQD